MSATGLYSVEFMLMTNIKILHFKYLHYKLYSDLFVTLMSLGVLFISHRQAPVSRPLLILLQISQNTICSVSKKKTTVHQLLKSHFVLCLI